MMQLMKKFFVLFLTILLAVIIPLEISLAASFDFNNISGDDRYSLHADAADFDGDGDIDIYVANGDGEADQLWLNDGEGNFSNGSLAPSAETSNFITSADFNGDNVPDIYVTLYGTQNRLWLSNGSGGFVSSDITNDIGKSYYAVAGDLDNDDDIDLYVVNFRENNNVWINNGNGGFIARNIAGDSEDGVGALLVDFDSDQDLDIYTYNRNNGQNHLWINNGSADFTAKHITGDLGSTRHAVATDINGDNHTDLYIANDSNTQNRIWINDGNANFTANNISGDTSNSQYATISDFNNDDLPDIYVSNNSYGKNKMWLNNGDNTFTNYNIPEDGFGNKSVAVDFDNDNDIDIYSVYLSSKVLWLNDGDANFSELPIDGDDGRTSHVVVNDFNSDGQPDIYLTNYLLAEQNRLMLNSSTPPDTSNPIVSSLAPSNNSTDVDLNEDLVIVFNESVNVETGNIYVYDSYDNLVETIDVTSDTVSGDGTDTITVKIADLEYATSYSVQIDASTFDDEAGNSYAGIADFTTWNFTTRAYPAGGAISPWKGSGNDSDDESNGNKVDEVEVDAEKIDREVEVSERRKTIIRIILRILLERFGL